LRVASILSNSVNNTSFIMNSFDDLGMASARSGDEIPAPDQTLLLAQMIGATRQFSWIS